MASESTLPGGLKRVEEYEDCGTGSSGKVLLYILQNILLLSNVEAKEDGSTRQGRVVIAPLISMDSKLQQLSGRETCQEQAKLVSRGPGDLGAPP